MKKLIIGDLHCKKASIDVVAEVLAKCKKLATKCDLTIFTGDVNDTKAIIRAETIALLQGTFKDWPTPILIDVGNHDYNNSIECKEHSLEFLKVFGDKITVVDKPQFINGDAFLPYHHLEEKFLEEIENLKNSPEFVSGRTDLYCHQDMDFCKYSNGAPTGSMIKAEVFADFRRVFVGHIHLAQEFKNVIYIGTPYTESFKESDEKKRVIIYDDTTDKLLSVPLDVRQHVTHEFSITALEDLKDVKKQLKEKIKPGQLVRVIIEAPEGVEEKIKRGLFEGLAIETLKTKKIVTHKSVKIADTMSNHEVMGVYLKQLDISDKLRQTVEEWNKKILEKAEHAHV